MKLRALTPNDVSPYRDLRLRALREWPPAFGTPAEEEERLSQQDYSARLEETKDRCVIGAFEDQVLVGSVRLARYDSSNESHRAYLAGLYVMAERRGLGYGRALCAHAVARARRDGRLRRLNLTVVSDQKAAIALYSSLGFVIYGVEQEVFQARGHFFDQILMTLDLRKQPEQAPEPTPVTDRADAPSALDSGVARL